jgi:hypothetical protein
MRVSFLNLINEENIMNKLIAATTALAVLLTGTALAQQSSTTEKPAVSNPKNTAKTAAAPVAGKNSFTKTQARKRLEANGYTNVTGLSKDANSVWHGKAMKAGKETSVTLDYQGNINEQ